MTDGWLDLASPMDGRIGVPRENRSVSPCMATLDDVIFCEQTVIPTVAALDNDGVYADEDGEDDDDDDITESWLGSVHARKEGAKPRGRVEFKKQPTSW